HVKSGKKTSVQQEMIIQIGDKDDFGLGSINKKLANKVLEEYFEEFEKRNPNLKIYNAVIHNDEASPHLHLNFVPVADGYKRGLEKQVSFDRAIVQQDPTLDKVRPFQDWRNKEAEIIENDMVRRGLGRKIVGTNDYKDVNDFKEKKALEKEIQVLEMKVVERKNELSSFTENIPDEIENMKMKKEVVTEVTQKMIGKSEITEKETENYVVTPEQLESLLKYGNDGMAVSKDYKRLLKTDLVKSNKAWETIYGELDEEKDELISERFTLKDELEKSQNEVKEKQKKVNYLQSKVTELKDEIQLIYSGARDFVSVNTNDVSSGRRLFESFKQNVKEQFENSRKWHQFKPEKTEFEKLDKIDSDKQRNTGRGR
ncbi:MAG: plasmid recombination protein, partial [Lactococcus lactis]|nr:plasmid recombination protein [Lactococcus lactis]